MDYLLIIDYEETYIHFNPFEVKFMYVNYDQLNSMFHVLRIFLF